jgi:glycosyltransferase involved in cell wall biosynthesis
MDEFPLVTVAMPTMASRREWLPKAIACFESQTWPNKELLIVDDGSVDLQPSGRIRVLSIIAPLGEKRNLACERAAGEFIVHFDDDDFSAPERIAEQVALLKRLDRAVAGFHSLRFTDGVNWWENHNHPGWAYDASLCYRRDFWKRHPFAPVNDGLEAEFRVAAASEKQLATMPAGDLMYATIHDGNTSRRHVGTGWTPYSPFPAASESAGDRE